jgi:hypothetical protein
MAAGAGWGPGADAVHCCCKESLACQPCVQRLAVGKVTGCRGPPSRCCRAAVPAHLMPRRARSALAREMSCGRAASAVGRVAGPVLEPPPSLHTHGTRWALGQPSRLLPCLTQPLPPEDTPACISCYVRHAGFAPSAAERPLQARSGRLPRRTAELGRGTRRTTAPPAGGPAAEINALQQMEESLGVRLVKCWQTDGARATTQRWGRHWRQSALLVKRARSSQGEPRCEPVRR